MIDGIDQAGSVYQPGPWTPMSQRPVDDPDARVESQRHTSATTTQLVTTGGRPAQERPAETVC